ncbi:TonB-dependent receptor [Sphingopyxis yananensis]|uniref:TonB-dependent receptor n=1 Tax=Sphingopyxis yananensis TaxID=2886687 RepID=UPI001D11F099|nr:TonB-dependent receptor [Sphingopyxis yananensis]MCC2601145.1 TonB-dependent receptor [Sphingopyxis yananensis]
MKNFSYWLASAALCAIATPAFAQDAGAPASDNASSYGGLAEIIVTAEKRSVDLQDLSQAVSAYTADARQLAGIATLQDFAAFTPGLSYSAGNDRVFIRGIGRQTNTNGSDPGISTYTDGIYDTATASVGASDFFIERIEVLRGPQGTLYGRNSIGGAINAISKRPTDEFTADIRTTIGNYDVFNLEAAISGTVFNGLRARLAGGHYEQDKGYFKSTVGNPSEGNKGTRRYVELQLEADLGDNTKAWIKAFTGSRDMYPRPNNLVGAFDFALFPSGAVTPGAAHGYLHPGFIALDPNPAPAGATNPRRFSTDSVQREIMRNNYGITGDITFSASTFDVRLLGGYQQYEFEQRFDIDNTSMRSYQEPLAAFDFTTFSPICLFIDPSCTPLTVYPSQIVDLRNKKSFGSGELSFASTTNGPLQWVAGLYYYEESLAQSTSFRAAEQMQLRVPVYTVDPLTFAPIFAPANPSGDYVYAASDLRTRSYAAYAQLDYQINDALRVTGGIRYTKDKKSGVENFRILCLGCVPGLGIDQTGSITPAFDITAAGIFYGAYPGVSTPVSISPVTGMATRGLSNSWDAVTGTIAIEYKPSDDQLAFLRYSRGYKSGGFNAGAISEFPQTNAEYINAYEAGYKHSFDNRLRANLALFYYDYKGLQVPLTVNTPGGARLTQFFNLKKSKSYGAEIELAWQATDALQLMVNYGYGKSRIDSGCCFVDGEDPAALQPGAKPVGVPVGLEQAQSVVGQELSDTPRHKVAANAMYNINFSAGTLTLSGSYMWRDASYSKIFNRSYNRIPSFDQVDARLIWTAKDDSYRMIAFAKNIFNTLGYDSASGTLLLEPTPGAVAQSYSYTPPRTFGVQLDVRFR